jgi:acyl-CoA thioesterase FadM
MSGPAGFRHQLVTRGTEIDAAATVTPYAFLRYFEHLRWEIMQDPALGLIDFIHDSHFFVVREQRLELRRRVGMGTELRLDTRLGRCGRSTADVLHEARRADDGALVARAIVTGVWLNSERRMARIPDPYRALSSVHSRLAAIADDDPAAALEAPAEEAHRGGLRRSFISPRSWAAPPRSLDLELPREALAAPLHIHPLTVAPRDLDVFGHVNAATWLAFAEDARDAAARAGRLTQDCTGPRWLNRVGLFYGREAIEGQRLDLAIWQPGPATVACAFLDASSGAFLGSARCDLTPGASPITAPPA